VPQQLENRALTLLVQDALDRNALIADDSDVTVDTKGDTVTLSAYVRTWAERDAVVGAAWMANGVPEIRDPAHAGGLGMVEVTLVSITVGFGRRPTAVLAVLGYRLVNYWLPLLPGAVAYLRLRLKQEKRTYRTTGAWCRFLGACPAGNLGREKSPGLEKARDDQ
jgi:hypothetical protein